MHRIDKFVDDTSFIWFLALIMTVGFMGWLVVWAVYEILMAIFLTEEEKPKKKKKPKKEKPDVAPAQEPKKDKIKEEKVYI